MKYEIFTRTWYDKQGNPKVGRSTHYGYANSREEAIKMCEEYNKTIKGSNKQSRKAEFQSC